MQVGQEDASKATWTGEDDEEDSEIPPRNASSVEGSSDSFSIPGLRNETPEEIWLEKSENGSVSNDDPGGAGSMNISIPNETFTSGWRPGDWKSTNASMTPDEPADVGGVPAEEYLLDWNESDDKSDNGSRSDNGGNKSLFGNTSFARYVDRSPSASNWSASGKFGADGNDSDLELDSNVSTEDPVNETDTWSGRPLETVEDGNGSTAFIANISFAMSDSYSDEALQEANSNRSELKQRDSLGIDSNGSTDFDSSETDSWSDGIWLVDEAESTANRSADLNLSDNASVAAVQQHGNTSVLTESFLELRQADIDLDVNDSSTGLDFNLSFANVSNETEILSYGLPAMGDVGGKLTNTSVDLSERIAVHSSADVNESVLDKSDNGSSSYVEAQNQSLFGDSSLPINSSDESLPETNGSQAPL